MYVLFVPQQNTVLCIVVCAIHVVSEIHKVNQIQIQKNLWLSLSCGENEEIYDGMSRIMSLEVPIEC